MKRILLGLIVLVLAGVRGPEAHAGLVLLDQFSPGSGTLVSSGFDSTMDRVWVHSNFGADLRSYSRTGSPLSTLGRPGEITDDVDVDFSPTALTLGSTVLPAGTLLFVNGQTGTADIYAVDKSSGAIITTLTTSFGVSHVVGGAYHPGRGTFFLLQDDQPGSADRNRIAEIDPSTGNVLNSFQITGLFDVYYGDLEVSTATGNLLVVSSFEPRIAEFTPTGMFLQYLALPVGVNSLSGIGLDDARGEAWVSSTNGTVFRLGGLPSNPAAVPEPATTLLCGLGLGLLVYCCRQRPSLSAAALSEVSRNEW